ncbi:aspartate-semialdehyde dehydrogenase [Sporolactobacillus sp. THM19-2]|uniref:aspartate-semialdehyde dehydrogenase n=1 Tax=Sporolactobacillus sp. THM19-2 TaxID=2511171 RepID=UPI001021E14C|nr:aspartate-semialdehyde dehydrogenase [Sporolactobacillus sp. THM19-2]RYL86852.1 aspartate-semialdehyde dehydrogenase [Sporolactobacillus sp. THM19-2]
MSEKLRVGILGGTGFVGQRFITLLEDHPFFKVTTIAASGRSAGKTYEEAVKNRWKLNIPMPDSVKAIQVKDVQDVEEIKREVDFVFCALKMAKDEIRELEEKYAKAEIPVISNNSAHRGTPDVPMVIPEINSDHLKIIDVQKKRLGTKYGFVAVKPNCSIQSYVPPLSALKAFEPEKVVVSTYQAISGAGKTFKDWPEIEDNVVPFISGEEEKSEQEPLKIWGHIQNGNIVNATEPLITTQCIRVPVSDGHLATVFVSFRKKPTREQILECWASYSGKPQELHLPSAPKQFLKYMTEDDRPQTGLDRDFENGMGITMGRLREDTLFDYKFVCLSHNTLRGAAGGGVLTAELLKEEGYLLSRKEKEAGVSAQANH